MLWLFACLFLSASAEVGNYIKNNVSRTAITGDSLTVHIVTHTHDDPGWLITVDQYYVEEVEWIFYTMIPVLLDNPIRKFTYVEMAYMHRWWEEIDDDLKQDTVSLINNGQLQMNLGGWCMNDEASPTASAVIHQMTDGNQFILNSLGTAGRPTVAWHVDPFGHSWVTGGLWAQAGFDAFGVHRINYLDLERRKNEQNLEFMWEGSTSLGEEGYIFFHILDSGYCSPHEINFWDGGSWITTDPLLPSWPPNQIEIAEEFVADSRTRSAWFKHDQLLIPFGCDFAHQNAYQSMIQMDKLIEYINSNATYNVTVLYSTLADYVGAVNALDLTWELEQSDFFTYVDSPHAWWSGYFTSRPLLKLYTRSRMNDLRVAEQLYLFAKNLKFTADFAGGMGNISYLRDAIGVTQHHDAITGTEKNAVFEEYMYQLQVGTQKIDYWDESVIGQFLRGSGGQMPVLLRGNDMISQLTINNLVVMVAYNSLAWNITEFLVIPSNRSDLIVYDSKSNIIESQINPVCTGEQMFKYPNQFNVFILAQNMKPLSFETFFIGIGTNSVVGKEVDIKLGETFKAGSGGSYTISIDGTTNRLSSITNNDLGQSFNVENQFSQYVPSGGIYNDGYIPSGAYIFRPATDNRLRLNSNNDGSDQNKPINVVFRQNLLSNASPGIILQTHCNSGQYADTYNAQICSMDTTSSTPSFTYQYYRIDASTWGQQPLLDFVVFDNNNPIYSQLVEGQQTGSILVSKSSNSYSKITINFASAFNNNPGLLVTLRNTVCDGSQFVNTISEITTISATIYIQRIDSSSAWNNNIYLDYIAYDISSVKISPLMVQGTTTISLPSSTKTMTNITINVDNNNDFVLNEPVYLLSIKQISPVISTDSDVYYFGTTTYDNNNLTFGINFYPSNPSGSGNVQFEVTYIGFERITLFGNVTNDLNINNVMIAGPLMDEVQQTFKTASGSEYSQTFRLFNIRDPDLSFIDNRVHIGPIDQGAEFITKFTTELSSDYEYYTNQAGLEYVKRVYNPYIDERIAGNYYPSSGASYIADAAKDIRFSTIINQGHGIGSLVDGEFEMMLQRRCLQDDQRGVAEVLNNTYHTEPQIMIIMDNDESSSYLNRRYYQIQQFQHSFFFGLTDTISSYTEQYNTSWTAINSATPEGLPDNIFLQQLRYGYSGSTNGLNGGIIMQLQNMFQLDESSQYSQNVSVDLNGFIDNRILSVVQSTEMNLLSSIALSDLHRLPWNIKDNKNQNIKRIRDNKDEEKRRKLQKIKDQSPIINLAPRDIRTFVINAKVDRPNTTSTKTYGI